jgi:hypothetical protein
MKFKTGDDVISAIRTWLHEDKEWYLQRIHALVSRWGKAGELDGDLVEKCGLETNLLTSTCVIFMIFEKTFTVKET